jgi:FtsP/CotA-like multicopper oxidase with cupredoxin domain
VNRRDFLALSGLTAADLAWAASPLARATEAEPAKADFVLRIAPVRLELGPGNIVETIGYNGTAPGPLLRMREGKRVTVEVHNDTDVPELVHWHGQLIPSDVDGAEEEGTPFVPARGRRRITFTPQPAGTRWYHTHAMAADNLNRGGYTGQYGFLYVEPKSEPGNYDQEIFLATRHWGPSLAHMGPPDNGWEIAYSACSINDKALGHGEPIRVRKGQRVLFRLLNASATEDVRLALPGHKFRIIALDGNPVPSPQAVDVVQLGVAERVDAVVEMNQPGVWVLGSASDDERAKGMGVVVEYAGESGEPQWAKVPRSAFDYTIFGSQEKAPEADERIELTFEKIPGKRVTYNRWTINGKSWPDADPILVKSGRRYRLIFHNKNGDSHPLHLHRHSFEITNFGGKATSGIIKDVVDVPRFSDAEVDFVANNPGPSLFHCHMLLHMDFGFKTLVKYT